MKPVIIYTTPTCGFCKMTKEFFSEHKIEYGEHDVSTDQARAQEMVDISGQMGVPVVLIGEGEEREMVIGFDEAKLRTLLDIK